MSIFENMGPREIAICLSAFYEEDGKVTRAFLCFPDRVKYITVDQKAFDEGIKILREDYDVFWTPDTKPDDLKWKINKRLMKELDEEIAAARKHYDEATRRYIDADIMCTQAVVDPGCVVMGNDYLYRRELGLPDDATVADILEKIRKIKMRFEESERLRKNWHTKYEEEHKECVRLSKLHAAEKKGNNEKAALIHNLRDNQVTLENSVAALKKRIRSMEAEAAEKETKNKVITDTLRDNLVDSIEKCKRLKGRIRLLEDQLKLNGVPPLEDPLDFDS